MTDKGRETKILVEFKKKLEKKIAELKSELDEQQAMLEAVNSVLIDKGFKHVELSNQPAESKRKEEGESKTATSSMLQANVLPLNSDDGRQMASLEIRDDTVQVSFPKETRFTVDTPPFKQFLVERVLEKMHEKNSRLSSSGHLSADKVFHYDIIQRDDFIDKIVIRGVDPSRLKELKSSIRWTLQKMYDKTKK